MTILRGAAVLLLAATIAGCAGDRRPSSPGGRIVIAVYTDIDGVCFSSDGSNYARFTDFLEREENVSLSPAQMSNLLEALDRQGFFKEKNRELTAAGRSATPSVFRVCVAAPGGKSKECVFYHEAGSQVPLKYREIFRNLPLAQVPKALERFLQLNQQCDR